MITVDELKAAIAECEGERNPNANTCFKLSAYHILLMVKEGVFERQSYSHAAVPELPVKEMVGYYSETEFGKVIRGKSADEVLKVMDELMTVLQAIKPNLYDGVLRKVRDI